MQPKTFNFSPVTASVTGFASNVTGASWTLTNTATTDGLAHQVTIKGDAVTNHSDKTANIVGTDIDNMAQTETLTLPNGVVTVTSTKFFKTVTSVTPSATIGADTMDIGWAAPSYSQTYPLDWPNVTGGGVSLGIAITGTINYKIQHTLDDIFRTQPSTLVWIDHSSLTNKTATADGNYAFPVKACRFYCNSVTNGATVAFTILQGAR